MLYSRLRLDNWHVERALVVSLCLQFPDYIAFV